MPLLPKSANTEAGTVLLLTLEFPPFKGGVANYYHNLARFWPDGNLLVLADKALLDRTEAADCPDDCAVQYVPLLGRFWPRWLAAIARLRELKKEYKIKHIIAGQILPLGAAACLAGFFYRTAYTIVIHGQDFSYARRNSWKRRLTNLILSGAQHIICGNTAAAVAVKASLPETEQKKISIVNPGIADRPEPEPARRQTLAARHATEDKFVLMSLGRLVARKGFDRVLESLPLIVKAVPNLLYVLAGAGPDEARLKEIAARLPKDCQQRIHWLGAVSEADKEVWLSLCSVFIMPARPEKTAYGADYEGFGIVYLEANLAGKPVIALDSGGVADAVKNGENGWLLKSDDPESIAQAVIRLAHNKTEREQLGKQGRERALAEFAWPEKARAFYNIIS